MSPVGSFHAYFLKREGKLGRSRQSICSYKNFYGNNTVNIPYSNIGQIMNKSSNSSSCNIKSGNNNSGTAFHSNKFGTPH
jgi:hypothetical protein